MKARMREEMRGTERRFRNPILYDSSSSEGRLSPVKRRTRETTRRTYKRSAQNRCGLSLFFSKQYKTISGLFKIVFSFHYTSQTRFDQSDLLINNLVFNVPLQKSKNLDFLIS